MSVDKVICVIPARYASTRLPGKPLVDIGGRTMIEWVYQRAMSARLVTDALVATDDERVYRAVEEFGGRVVMTSQSCRSGSERVAEAVEGQEARLVVNLQGDEPLIEPAAIDQLIDVFSGEPEVEMATLMRRITARSDIDNPNNVKVVVDNQGYALYFSRATIPYKRDFGASPPDYYHHYGLYAFRPETLKRFVRMPVSPLEEAEQLEQLRAMSGGIRIRVLETQHSAIGVDTREDLEKVRGIVGKGIM